MARLASLRFGSTTKRHNLPAVALRAAISPPRNMPASAFASCQIRSSLFLSLSPSLLPPPSPPHPPLSLARALSLSSYLSLPSLSFSVYFPLSSSPFQRSFTEVKYPLLRACSSSAVLTAAGLHTHVRTHRTSSDPAYLHTYVYLYMKREEEEECC
jgi:hypothetical protein